jgi:hypothetical protein
MGDSSILFEPGAIALLANSNAIDDLELFLSSLQLWNSTLPPIYMFCTRKVQDWIPGKYRGVIMSYPELEQYEGLDRQQMERMPSKKGRPNLFHDFTEEKCNLMRTALKDFLNKPQDKPQNQGVLFCDADLLWLAALPKIPEGVSVVLSPHMIHKHDEDKYGHYNAGLLWTNSVDVIAAWEEACKTSHFFEQAALEKLEIYKPALFPTQMNYGWWRMFQSPNGVKAQQDAWSIKRDAQQGHSGILVDGNPLICIHTHWKTTDRVTQLFNDWVASKLALLKSQSKVKMLLKKL